ELVHAQVAQRRQLLDVCLGGAEQAEPVDDLVGDEVGGRVAGPSVVAVVVALPPLDVRGQRLGDHAGVLTVAGDEVGDVVADHAAEPAALLAGGRQAVTDVGGSGDADGDGAGIPPRLLGRGPYGLHHPLGEVGVAELEDAAGGLP